MLTIIIVDKKELKFNCLNSDQLRVQIHHVSPVVINQFPENDEQANATG